jgi:hypothetical protein
MAWGYYAYVIGDDGHVRNRIEVLCDNDDEAKRCAEQLVDGHAIELWQEGVELRPFSPKIKTPQLAAAFISTFMSPVGTNRT